MILSYTTAYQMLTRLKDLEPGMSCLVHAAGGAVGTALLELGALMGLRMFGTASPAKHELVRRFGATPIDYRSEDFVVEIGVRTGARGVHAAFDAISLENFRRSYDTLTDDGILVTYGLYRSSLESEAGSMWSMAREFIGFQWQKLMWQWFGAADRRVQFYSITQMRETQPAWFREDLETLVELLGDGKIDPQVWRVMPLQQAAEAHRLIEDGEVRGKIVLKVSD